MTATETLPATVKVGDIFYNSWGYDQTNIDFYVVDAVSPTGKTCTVRPCGSQIVEAHGPGGNRVVPDPSTTRRFDVITGLPDKQGRMTKQCKIRSGYRGGCEIVLRSGEHWGWPYEGGSHHETDTMFGR